MSFFRDVIQPRRRLTLRAICLLLFAASAFGGANPVAQIVVHREISQGAISPYLFGLSLEWLDNGNGVLDATTNAPRQDILNLLTPLHVPVWRFPGGILSDYYHWQDGVGPVAGRPPRANPMDGSMHANNFGTDELIAFCKAQKSQVLITANFGTGTLSEALAWQTYFTNQGLPVKFWEIGNEIYLAEPTMPATIAGNDARIYRTPSEYASAFPTWARSLRGADPSALIGAIAGTTNTSVQNQGWLDTLLSNAGQDIDFIALHNSFAPLIFTVFDYSYGPSLLNVYGAMYAQAANAGDDTLYVRQRLSAVRPASQRRIAITEHFPLFGSGATTDQFLGALDQSRTQGSALFTASLFHNYIRQQAFMANYNLATSPWFGALITQTSNGLVKTPTYYVYDLYRNHFGTSAVSVDVTSPTYDNPAVGSIPAREGIAYLDAVASRDSAGRTYLAVVNRSTSTGIDTSLSVSGLSPSTSATVYSLQAAQVNAINGTGLTATTMPASMTTKVSTWTPPVSGVFTFPPNSVTILVW